MVVNIAPAITAIFPWVSAHTGRVDVVYYAMTAGSENDPSTVGNVYLAQTRDNGAIRSKSSQQDAESRGCDLYKR